MTIIGYLLIGAVVLLALGAVLYERRRTKATLRHMEQMLDAAVAGRFLEEPFDESLLSAVESRLSDYLSASAVSERNLQEEKDKIKTLIADISHQTKTPIANVLLYAELLREQPLSPEGRELTGALSEQAEKLRSLIDALVKTSRLETGVLALHPVAAPLMDVLQSAAAQLSPKAAEKGISLSVAPTEVSAVFDPRWTEEAVCNLLDNAVKYTPAGGAVSLSVTAYELFCRLDVTDTGPGIKEAEQSLIFQRFYRSPAAGSTEGVGIGLYLCRQIAERQGGYIKVSSRVGAGSTFSLFLPRGTADSAAVDGAP